MVIVGLKVGSSFSNLGAATVASFWRESDEVVSAAESGDCDVSPGTTTSKAEMYQPGLGRKSRHPSLSWITMILPSYGLAIIPSCQTTRRGRLRSLIWHGGVRGVTPILAMEPTQSSLILRRIDVCSTLSLETIGLSRVRFRVGSIGSGLNCLRRSLILKDGTSVVFVEGVGICVSRGFVMFCRTVESCRSGELSSKLRALVLPSLIGDRARGEVEIEARLGVSCSAGFNA